MTGGEAVRDGAIALGGAYVAVCVIVIAVAAISERFGKDHDRRDGTSTGEGK